MRNVIRVGFIVAVSVLLISGTALAQFDTPSELSGTMVGDRGGAYQVWNVELPASSDVTLTLSHWPCNTGNAIGVEVWGANGLIGRSRQQDACSQTVSFNTGTGGAAEIKAYNYLSGVGTWWSLSATGMALPGGMAPKPAPAVEPAAAEAAAPAAEGEMAAAAAPAPAPAPAAPMAPAAGAVNVDNAVLYGTEGGGIMKYDFMVVGGTTYDATLTYASPNGGNWPGVGFTVWGPTGLVAKGSGGVGQASASFTAGGNDMYTVEVHNYHPGVPVFYALSVAAQ